MTSSRVAMVAVCLLAACGGGDEFPDEDLLGVTATPAAGDVWLHDPIVLTFSAPIDPATLIPPPFRLVADDVPVEAEVTPSADRTRFTVVAAPSAAGYHLLRVEVASTIADTEGRRMSSSTSFGFTLTAWQRPKTGLERGASPARPSVAAGADRTIMAWQIGAAGARRVVVSELVGGAWQALGGELGAADAQAPAVAIDADGRPVVAWAQIAAGGSTIEAARWDGAAWQALPSPGAVESRPAVGDGQVAAVLGPALAAPAGGGAVAVAWNTGTSATAVPVKALVGDTWTPLGAPLPGGAVVATPVLSSPSDGRVVVAFLVASFESAGRFPSQRIFAHRWDGAAWQPLPEQFAGFAPGDFDGVTEEGEVASGLSLATVGDDVTLAWDHREIANPSVLVARLVAGVWQPVGPPVNVDPAGEAVTPSIQLDADGQPIVAWTEVIEGVARGVVARWSGTAWVAVGGDVWSEAAPLAPRLVLWRGRAPIVAWQTADAVRLARWNGPAAERTGLIALFARCSVAADPATLSATGCFVLEGGRAIAHGGVVPYDVVVEEWTDGSQKRRWIAVPGDEPLTVSAAAWDGPVGTIAIQELSIETTRGDPSTLRPVETRFLERTASGWRALSYQWRADRSDADLLPGTATVTADWPQGARTYTHVYPSRDECTQCHSAVAGGLLGVRTAQLARRYDYAGVVVDQLTTFAAIGLIPAVPPATLTSPLDVSAGFERRMRGYLDTSCAHCHRPGAAGASLDLRATTAFAETHLCSVITPGNQDGSPLFQLVRSRSAEPPRGMPPIGSRVLDPLAVHVVGKWIASAPAELCP